MSFQLWDSSAFIGLSASMDFGTYFVQAEATTIDVEDNGAVADTAQQFITVGMRLPQQWTVSLTYETTKDEADAENYSDYLDAFDAALQDITDLNNVAANATIAGYRSGLVAALEAAPAEEENILTLGARWDFHPKAAFKAELIQKEDEIDDLEPQAVRLGLDLIF